MPPESKLDFEYIKRTKKYRGIKKLGVGSYGSVWKVSLRNDPERKAYALKILTIESSKLDRTLQEVKMLNVLHDKCQEQLVPCIYDVSISELGNGKVVVMILMSLVSGISLSHIPDMYPGFNNVQLYKNIMGKCVEGLNEIHDKGMLHLDIHGGNILINGDFKTGNIAVTFIDFGFACIKPGTCDYAPFGAVFSPPEHALTERVSKLSDVYQLGFAFYDLMVDPESKNYLDVESKFKNRQDLYQVYVMQNGASECLRLYNKASNELKKSKYDVFEPWRTITLQMMECVRRFRPRLDSVIHEVKSNTILSKKDISEMNKRTAVYFADINRSRPDYSDYDKHQFDYKTTFADKDLDREAEDSNSLLDLKFSEQGVDYVDDFVDDFDDVPIIPRPRKNIIPRPKKRKRLENIIEEDGKEYSLLPKKKKSKHKTRTRKPRKTICERGYCTIM